MKAIAFIGPQCSGKTTAMMLASESVFAKTPGNIFFTKFAGPLYKVLSVFGKPKDRAFMQKLSTLAKETWGRDIFIDVFDAELKEIIQEHDPQIILNDDCRFMKELNYLKAHGWKTVYIEADRDVRRARAEALGLEFLEEHETEVEVPELKPFCDMVINNDGPMRGLKEKVKEVI